MAKAIKTIRGKAKAFSGQDAQVHLFRVDLRDESVSVWDVIAGGYTICHSLSEKTRKSLVDFARTLDQQ